MSPEAFLQELTQRGYGLNLCTPAGTLEALEPSALIQAALSTDTNFVDFIALPTA